MKTFRKPEHIEKAEKLAKVIDLRKNLDRKEKELKEYIKKLMGDEVTAKIGAVVITIDKRTKIAINTKAIEADYGQDFTNPYKFKTNYQILTVKKGA